MAVVLSRQRELDAFVLIGRARDGSVLRSDEVATLCAALHSVGVEWQALRWDALQRELACASHPALTTPIPVDQQMAAAKKIAAT